MATNYKILGQAAPLAETETTLYTCPLSNSAAISSIAVCNRGSTEGTFRIAVKPTSANTENENYIIYDDTVSANKTSFIKNGISLDEGNIIEVYASSADFSFSAFGIEIF